MRKIENDDQIKSDFRQVTVYPMYHVQCSLSTLHRPTHMKIGQNIWDTLYLIALLVVDIVGQDSAHGVPVVRLCY